MQGISGWLWSRRGRLGFLSNQETIDVLAGVEVENVGSAKKKSA